MKPGPANRIHILQNKEYYKCISLPYRFTQSLWRSFPLYEEFNIALYGLLLRLKAGDVPWITWVKYFPQTWLPALISLSVVYTSTHKCYPPYSSLFLIGSLRKAKKILKTPTSITWINTHRNTIPLQVDDITQLYTLVANSSIYLKGHKLYMCTAHPWNVQCVECLRPCLVFNRLSSCKCVTICCLPNYQPGLHHQVVEGSYAQWSSTSQGIKYIWYTYMYVYTLLHLMCHCWTSV